MYLWIRDLYEALRNRLAENPCLKGYDLSSRAGIERALEDLGRECDVSIRDTATAVFVSTAISQNGQLDTVFVLMSHLRMVWRIARVYSQRLALRNLINLYANVSSTAFVAGELDDMGKHILIKSNERGPGKPPTSRLDFSPAVA